MSATSGSRIDAATQVNRLAHNLLARSGDERLVARISAAASELADALQDCPLRSRETDIDAAPQFMDQLLTSPGESIIADGQNVNVFGDSPVTGAYNPFSVGLAVRRDRDEAVGTVTLGPGWEGAPGRSHGGIVASLVDETMGCLLPIIGTMAFTGKLDLTYRAPCPLAVPIEFRARLQRRDGRKLYLECTGSGPDGVFVESVAVFISVALDLAVG